MRALALLLAAASLLAVTAAPAVAAEPPPDAFCIVLIEAVDGFRQVRISVDEDLNQTDHDRFFAAADRDGDAIVELDEAHAFRQAGMRFWPSADGLPSDQTVHLQMMPTAHPPQVAPIYVATWRQVGHGVSPHVSAQDTIDAGSFETQSVRDYRFHSLVPQTSHVTVIGNRQLGNWTMADYRPLPQAVIEYVVVQAPPGWTIEWVKGYGYNGTFQLDVGESRVDIPGFDTSAPFEILFVDPAQAEANSESMRPKGGPALEAATLALAVLAAVLVVRLRRR